jgi:hypothetical protein
MRRHGDVKIRSENNTNIDKLFICGYSIKGKLKNPGLPVRREGPGKDVRNGRI